MRAPVGSSPARVRSGARIVTERSLSSRRGDPHEEPTGPAPALGDALRRRVPEIVDHVVGTWRQTFSGAQPESKERDVIEASIRESVRAGTDAVIEYLVSGANATRLATEKWDWSGEAAVNGMFSLPDLTRLFLDWRRTCVDAVRAAARELGASDEEMGAAVNAVRAGSDTSMVRMTRRFDATRRETVDRLAETQGRLEHQALHDSLTGLANRVLLRDRLARVLDGPRRRGLAVLFLDLDSFKLVNDVLGHAAGDELLVEVGARLHSVLRPTDMVARWGGDEFVVVCEDMTEPVPEAMAVADRLLAVLRGPIRLSEHETEAAASVGVALAEPGDDPEKLVERADQAMLRAKRHGRGRVELYDARLDDEANRHASDVESLRRALGESELAVEYRPVWSLSDRRLVAREAMAGWQEARSNGALPGELRPPTGRGGVIREIGDWLLRQACEECARWRAAGEPDVSVAVNVSALEFEAPRFVDEVQAVLASAGLAPGSLVVEISESLLTVDEVSALVGVERLHRLGVRVVVDEFGTGQCSLTWLARLPVDMVKVDASLVAAIGTSQREARIARAVVQSARSLGLRVVADGVTTATQLEQLVAMGCDDAMGPVLEVAAAQGAAPPG